MHGYSCEAIVAKSVLNLSLYHLFCSLMWVTRDSKKPQVQWGTESGRYRWIKSVSCRRGPIVGVSLIAGLDSPLEHGTGTWDWNVGQESSLVGHTIH